MALPLKLGAIVSARTQSELSPRIAAIQRAGFRFVQFNIPNPADTAFALDAIAYCEQENLPVEAIGCYANPMAPGTKHVTTHSDDDLRKLLEELPPRREDQDAYRIITWSGTLSGKLLLPHPGHNNPGALAELKDWVKEIHPLLERANACMLLHPHYAHVLGTHHVLHRFLMSLDSAYVGAVFDFTNWLSPKTFGDRDMLLNESLKKLAPYIGFAHIKDMRIDQFKLTTHAPGQGQLAFAGLLKLLRRYINDVPWVVDGANSELELQRAREYLEVQSRL
jgi:sugar phosphate isomerase/epimerase